MRARVNGTELFYEAHGQGAPMLVMHGGLGLDHTYLRPWLDAVGDAAEVVYYDHRGNGRSARPERWEDVACEAWVEDADALRAHLRHERILLFAHSFGGFIAQEYALRHGDRLAGLILCCTAPAQDYPEVVAEGLGARATAEQGRLVGEAFSGQITDDRELERTFRALLPLYFHPSRTGPPPPLLDATSFSAGAFNRYLHCVPAFDTTGRLEEIRVPTLVLGGRGDWMFPPAQGPERLAAGIPGAELHVFEESAHVPFVEQPAEFAGVVRDWIGRVA